MAFSNNQTMENDTDSSVFYDNSTYEDNSTLWPTDWDINLKSQDSVDTEIADTELPTANGTTFVVTDSTASIFQLRDEPWVLPLLILSSINLFVIVIFEIFVLYKSCGNRHRQFLGQTLLFGLFLCSLLGYTFVITPHWVVCAIVRAGVGFAYAIVFSTLLVKCFFLLNLHSGNYLNSAYQFLLLFFAIGVQVAIFVQWLIYRPPEIVVSDGIEMCKSPPLERVEYLSYVMFLLLLTIILSIRSRSLKENNKEAIYIGITVAVLVVVWVSWTSVFIIFDRRYEDPAQGFGLICTTIVVFLLVFVPKAIQLSLLCRKNGSNHESHSMIYSPSFLHLQPHAILPSSTEGTLIKQHNSADYCRFPAGFWRYDYPSFYQMEPRTFAHSDRSSQRKSNVSYVNSIY